MPDIAETVRSPAFRAWLDALKLPAFFDRDVLLAAGVIADDEDWLCWRDRGWLPFIVKATDEEQVALFGLIQAEISRTKRDNAQIRCGDHVRHRPTNETWIVAYADHQTNDLSPWGEAEKVARISDCERIKVATDEEHRALVATVFASGGMRGRKVARLYGAGPNEIVEPV